MARAKLDALSVFTILFAQCLTLQVAKDVQSHALTSWRILPTLALALAIVRAHLAPTSDHALVALAASGAVVLCVNGSQSNHVLLELAIAAAVLLCAPASLPVSLSSSPRTTREMFRRAFASRVSLSMRVALGILYLTTGFAKLNDDWHDPSVSCCVQMLVGALAGLGLSPSAVAAAAPAPLRAAAPYAATAFELGFPVVLVLARATRTVTPIRILAISGAIFHVFIALPPPPMSVYPFSMIMAPMYAAGLLPEETAAAARRVAAWPDEVKIAATTAAVAALALAYQAHASSNLFEYPNYFAWEIGASWVVVVFAALAAVAASPPNDPDPDDDDAAPASAHGRSDRPDTPRARRPPRRAAEKLHIPALLPGAFLLAVSASTYLGARTYPSFAMFSNLRMEGGSSNHWIVRAPGFFPGSRVDVPPEEYYGAHVGIEIGETDLASLRDMQVNLAPLFPNRVKEALRETGATAEFHIAPPSWGYPPTEETSGKARGKGTAPRGFSVPLVEVRRRISAAMREGKDFTLRYRWVRGGETEAKTREFRARGGELVKGSDPALAAPLPPWRAVLHRFRTFHLEYSPCRH